jgi:hypothetical protein
MNAGDRGSAIEAVLADAYTAETEANLINGYCTRPALSAPR